MSEYIENDDIVVLMDDEGIEHEFVLVAGLEIGSTHYVLLGESEESEDVFAFCVEESDDGDILVPVESDEELQQIEEAYDQMFPEDD